VRIGVLALQGDFLEHQNVLESLSVNSSQVRLPDDLNGLDGLIIPGGESTTIGKLAVDFHLMDPLRSFAMNHAVWGTCAGSIFLSKDARPAIPCNIHPRSSY
jgi:5'-phosphate synthase pdxT subunit